MPDENEPTSVVSEQAAPTSASPSEPTNVAESSPAPAAEVEKTPESTAPEVDLEAIRKQVAEEALKEARERARHEAESEFGKKASERERMIREEERLRQEQLLAEVADYVPDTQIAALRTRITEQQRQRALREQTERESAELQQWRQFAYIQQEAQKAEKVATEAGYSLSDLPPDVRGESPIGFGERFNTFLVKEVAKLKKQTVTEVKKAAEQAARDTERKLGVTTVAGAAPVGNGGGDLASLRNKLRDAHARGDDAAIREIGQRIEEEAYRRR